MPDSFQPPIGSGNWNAFVIALLTFTAPVSIRRPTRSARSGLDVHTLPPRPYGVSLARPTASSSSLKRITGRIGPNVSSRMQAIVWSTSTRTVGG